MSDTTTSGATPSEGSAETAGAPTTPVAEWGAFSSATRGSGLARGKRVSTPASPAPASNTAVSGAYKPTAIQILKAETEYQNPFASADEAPSAPAPASVPAPAEAAPAAPAAEVPPSEPPAPVAVAPVAPAAVTEAPSQKAELNILPPAETKRPAQSWESPSMSTASSAPTTTGLGGERPVFRPMRRSDAPMLEPAPNATGKGGGLPQAPKYGNQRSRGKGGDNRSRQNEGRPQQSRGQQRQSGNGSPKPAQASSNAPKKSSGLFGWVKGLFSSSSDSAPAIGDTTSGGRSQNGQNGDRGPEGGQRRRRRRGGRGRSGGGSQGGAQAGGGSHNNRSHGQGHPSHGHGGGDRSRGHRGGDRGRSGGHRHPGGGSGIPPSA